MATVASASERAIGVIAADHVAVVAERAGMERKSDFFITLRASSKSTT
jgi:hypothetical protein